ncbi:hypothetical protein Tco_1114207 [Tanacetum coccineum]|uniref:Uncharacterized protein n=1 Tax=Tanacetum coccineum TaxID=301880 RepID=A0ABQ5IY56_9ASTR
MYNKLLIWKSMTDLENVTKDFYINCAFLLVELELVPPLFFSYSKLVDEKVKSFLSQCLGKDICQLILYSDKVEFNHLIFHLLLDEVISDVNMLGSGVLEVVTA